jgi:predicted alpha/beta superfamily hydrolase
MKIQSLSQHLFFSFFWVGILLFNSCQPKKENALPSDAINFVVNVADSTIKQGENIYLVGSFNDWNPKDTTFVLKKLSDNQYLYSFPLSIIPQDVKFPITLEYKYTKGSWDNVERNAKNEEISNRTLLMTEKKSVTTHDTVATWMGKPKVSTAAANVKVMVENFEITSLGRKRTIWVYLPLDYEQNTQNRYPVLYLHDGQNLFDNLIAPFGEWNIDETLNNLNASVIVVGINHGDSLRLHEYSPYKNAQYGGGEGSQYLEFIVKELKPYVDKNYRTMPEAENTGIGGSSMGGLISFCAVMKYPTVFGKALVFSPSFWFSDDLFKDVEKNRFDNKSKIYMLMGGQEGEGMVVNSDKMDEVLKKKGFNKKNYLYKVVDEGKHSESFWSKEFSDAYQWLYLRR